LNGAFSFTRRKIGNKDVVLLTRRLADSLKGGLSLARALKVIETQSENPELSRIIKEIETAVREGKSFSEALGVKIHAILTP
jgi:type IV pilus assembly protein PilC